MSTPRARLRFVLALASLILLSAGSSISHAAQWHVASNGLDSNTCGPNDPCRSISAAIQRASAGDVILVSPGVYGDLNQNGVLGEPGEETGEIGYGCNCVLKVDKAVSIRSTQGALLTRIDVQSFTDRGYYVYGVHITADNATFGLPDQGFEISGSNYYSLRVDSSHVSISGNITSGPGAGFLVSGPDNELDSDIAKNDSDGFIVAESNNTLTNCLASGSKGFGFVVDRNAQRVPPTGITLRHDIATGNQQGFNIFGSATLSSVSAIDNAGGGIVLRVAANVTVSNSNIFGNGVLAQNCGVLNQSGLSTVVSNVFWGAANGPGAEPADAVCDLDGSSTTVPSVAAKAFRTSFDP